MENPSNVTLAIVLMLLSSFCYALTYTIQHRGTQQALGDGAEKPGLGALLKNPFWLGSLFTALISFVLHIAALSFGSVSIVQPLMVTELIFIPPLAMLISKAKITRRDWIAVLVLSAGLAAFLIAAQPTEGSKNPATGTWAIVIAGTYILAAVIWFLGRNLAPTPRAALYGGVSALIGTLMALVAKGAFEGSSSPLYARPLFWLIFVAATSTIVSSSIAFRAGPITASSATLITLNPVISTIAAVVMFGDTIRITPVSVVVIVLSLVALFWGIFSLSRSESVHEVEEEQALEYELITEAVERDVHKAEEHLHHPKK